MFRGVSLLAAVAVAVPWTAGSADLWFLENAPVHYFTADDMKLTQNAAAEVLNDADPRAVREWSNPGNQTSGKIEGLGDYRSKDGLACRKLRVSNQARGIDGSATYPVCKDVTGEWKLASGKELQSR